MTQPISTSGSRPGGAARDKERIRQEKIADPTISR
jgi:hypothetical protein